MPSAARKASLRNGKAARRRTFTGCRTCRSRHAKCDETQPECGTCRRLGLVCGGYGARLFWITDEPLLRPEQQQSHRGADYRYPLFSELDRRLMSIELAESLGTQSPLDLLADIDSVGEKYETSANSGAEISKGPFGVFRAAPPATDTSDHSSSTEQPGRIDFSSCQEPEGPIEEVQCQEWSEQHGNTGLNLFVASLDPNLDFNTQDFGPNPGQLMVPDQHLEDMFLPEPSNNSLSIFSPGFISEATEHTSVGNEVEATQLQRHQEDASSVPCRGLIQGHASGFSLPEHTEPLLRHYKQHINNTTTTIQAKRKSPWQIIFLPCALETFAELSLWNNASHTRSAIFYTLLAHSAFQLHMTKHPGLQPGLLLSHWRDVGIRHQEKAQAHLRNALQLEMFGARQAKYRELLMAILAMAMTLLYNGAQSFKLFLLDAERLIRLRGLQKRNSFNNRILHHMYTHLRVMAESVSICSESLLSSPDNSIQSAVTEARTFRIGEEALNIGLDSTQEKTAELGYNDIHLEIQGKWEETLYPVIYGIPETLMTLLSQTISFSNEKRRLDALALSNSTISTALAHHVKTLETSIWTWSLPPERLGPPRPLEMDSDDEEALIDHPQARLMALAIHQALVIYFYRRVYNMSAMIMQEQVRKTLNFLEPCTDQMVFDQDFATSLAWPAFIAACEAVSPDLQEKALKCLTATDNHGVFFTPKPARDVVSQIWEQRASSGDWTLSWPSIVIDVS